MINLIKSLCKLYLLDNFDHTIVIYVFDMLRDGMLW